MGFSSNLTEPNLPQEADVQGVSAECEVLTGEAQEGLEALQGLGTNNAVLISLDSVPVSQAGFSLLGSRGMSPHMRRPELMQRMD